jgi:predicted phage terminase large subunit-like protein
MPARLRLRFLEGKFADITAGALWTIEIIDQYRHMESTPDLQRIIVAVDPSGAGDDDNAGNDAIGILVCALGIDGRAYVLEDATCKAGPKVWGNVVANAFERHGADCVVAEKNFGGEMVRHVLQTAKPGMPCKLVTASRGKVVRAEPISALTEQGKIRFAGVFQELEEELTSFTTRGYVGEGSPNRADAFVWAMAELFPGLVKGEKKEYDASQFTPTVSMYPSHA